jgi:catechol 2,3-dioxygenase-like lactoylglutathione lyase family enzyme
MARVTGIGGIFFKSADIAKLGAWYRDHLGIEINENSANFTWRGDDGSPGMTVLGLFAKDDTYFGNGTASFMINYRVDDLNAMLAQLRAAGVTVDDKVEDHDYGRFGWFTDPDGNRVELWEPPKE